MQAASNPEAKAQEEAKEVLTYKTVCSKEKSLVNCQLSTINSQLINYPLSTINYQLINYQLTIIAT